MGYIAFIDLLGTKDFSGEPAVYTENITCFYDAAREMSRFLGRNDKIGIFSDCLYAESEDLLNMVRFLTELRDRLCSQKMFFSGALMKGEIGAVSRAETARGNFFGVAFKNSMIADIYIRQTQFKGIGIYLDESIEKEVERLKGFRVVRSAYIPDISKHDIVAYNDIGYSLNRDDYSGYEESIVNTVLNQCLLAYSRSERYVRYYLSILAALINSCDDWEITWDLKNENFRICPLIFRAIFKMAGHPSEAYSQMPGLDILCLFILNAIFNSRKIGAIDRGAAVEKIMSFDCMEKRYSHSINDIPHGIMDEENREQLISIYQKNIVRRQVKELLEEEN